MGLFNFFKKAKKLPYKDTGLNLLYDLVFCDDIDLYKEGNSQIAEYPWNVLFSDTATEADIQSVIKDDNLETRIKILAYNKLLSKGSIVSGKELLAVIVEVGLENGLDILAVYNDGRARYINQSEKVIIWETSDAVSARLVSELFTNSIEIVNKIGPWEYKRKLFPEMGITRITFLVSDGLYFGEAPTTVLFNDQMAAPALQSATQFMKYLVEKE